MNNCPIEGCNSPHDSVHALINHIQNSTKEGHAKFTNRNQIREFVRNEMEKEPLDHPEEKGSNPPQPPSEGGSGGSKALTDGNRDENKPQPAGNTMSNDPTMDDGPPTVEIDPKCPECGGNKYFDATEHTDYDYGCPDCSNGENWVVWNE